MVTSEIVRLIIPRSPLKAAAFSALRKGVVEKGSAGTQYFGYVMPNQGFGHPRVEDEMCWYIEWPGDGTYRNSQDFKSELSKLSSSARALLFEFTETRKGQLIKGLESDACQLAIINLNPAANPPPPRFAEGFEHSMHKTFTDCYGTKGFTGGGWSYAMNSNDANGEELLGAQNVWNSTEIPEEARLLAYYCIGWDSIEVSRVSALFSCAKSSYIGAPCLCKDRPVRRRD